MDHRGGVGGQRGRSSRGRGRGRGRGYRRPEAPRRTQKSSAQLEITKLLAALAEVPVEFEVQRATHKDETVDTGPYSTPTSSEFNSEVKTTLAGVADVLKGYIESDSGNKLGKRAAIRESLLVCGAGAFPLKTSVFATLAGLLNANHFDFGRELVAQLGQQLRRSLHFAWSRKVSPAGSAGGSFPGQRVSPGGAGTGFDILRPEYENCEVAVLPPVFPGRLVALQQSRNLLRFCAELAAANVLTSVSLVAALTRIQENADLISSAFLEESGDAVSLDASHNDVVASVDQLVFLLAAALPYCARVSGISQCPGWNPLFSWLRNWCTKREAMLCGGQDLSQSLLAFQALREVPRDLDTGDDRSNLTLGTDSLKLFVQELVDAHSEATEASLGGGSEAYVTHWRSLLDPVLFHVQMVFGDELTDAAQHPLVSLDNAAVSTAAAVAATIDPSLVLEHAERSGAGPGEGLALPVDFRLFRHATFVDDARREHDPATSREVVCEITPFHRSLVQSVLIPDVIFAFSSSHREAAQELLPLSVEAVAATEEQSSGFLRCFGPLAVSRLIVETLLGTILCGASSCHRNRTGTAVLPCVLDTLATSTNVSPPQRSTDEMTHGILGALAASNAVSPTLPSLILTDLCNMAPAHFPAVLGQSIELMFRRISRAQHGGVHVGPSPGMSEQDPISVDECDNLFADTVSTVDTAVVDAFAEWFAYHLSQFDLSWDWQRWGQEKGVTPDLLRNVEPSFEDCLLLSEHQQPARHFVLESITRLLRLSFRDKVALSLPAEVVRFLPARQPQASFRWPVALQALEGTEQGGNDALVRGAQDSSPGGSQAAQLLNRMRLREAAHSLQATFLTTEDTATLSDAQKCDMVAQSVLVLGSKSFAHFMGQLERYLSLLQNFSKEARLSEQATTSRLDAGYEGPGRSGQQVILDSVADVWCESAQQLPLIINTLLSYTIFDAVCVCEWVIVGGQNSLMLGGSEPTTAGQWLQRAVWWEVIRGAIGEAVAATQLYRGDVLQAETKLRSVPAIARTIPIETRFISVPELSGATGAEPLEVETAVSDVHAKYDRLRAAEAEAYSIIFLRIMQLLAQRLGAGPATVPKESVRSSGVLSDVNPTVQLRTWLWYICGQLVAITREFAPRIRPILWPSETGFLSSLECVQQLHLQLQDLLLDDRLRAIWAQVRAACR